MNAKCAYPALFAALVSAISCNSHVGGSSIPSTNEEAVKSLGNLVPEPKFDRSFWQKQHDAESALWRQANRLCEQTVLANYPNCLPVSDLVQADQRQEAELGTKAAAQNEEMFDRGYQYDFIRRSWLPFRSLMADGCSSIPAYPNDNRRIGLSTWSCPQGVEIPKGIYDPKFCEEMERATD